MSSRLLNCCHLWASVSPSLKWGVGKRIRKASCVSGVWCRCTTPPLLSVTPSLLGSPLLLSWGSAGLVSSAGCPPSQQGLWGRPSPPGRHRADFGRERWARSQQKVQSTPWENRVRGGTVRGCSSAQRGQGPWGLFVSKVTGVRAGC